jgi:hypothetical protein
LADRHRKSLRQRGTITKRARAEARQQTPPAGLRFAKQSPLAWPIARIALRPRAGGHPPPPQRSGSGGKLVRVTEKHVPGSLATAPGSAIRCDIALPSEFALYLV